MDDVKRALLGDREAAKRPIILDLCGGSGSWSKPYKEAGYDVRLITLPYAGPNPPPVPIAPALYASEKVGLNGHGKPLKNKTKNFGICY